MGGCLLFDDYPFCKQVTQLNLAVIVSITDIGGLDASHTL